MQKWLGLEELEDKNFLSLNKFRNEFINCFVRTIHFCCWYFFPISF